MTEVTHPSDGIYLSKFMAGILSSILGIALVGTFANLWQLNANAILFQNHLDDIERNHAVLPGAVSRREWQLEKERRDSNYETLVAQIEALSVKLDSLNNK